MRFHCHLGRLPFARSRRRRILALSAALACGAGTTHAALPSAVSYEYIGLNFAENIQTSSAIGTLDYTGGPGCGGICTMTTALGADPSETIRVNEVVFEGTSGGGVDAQLGYYFEVPGSGMATVYLHGSESLTSAGDSESQAYVAVGPAGSNYSALNNFLSYTYQDTDCDNGCSIGVANYTSPKPLPTDQAVVISEGQLYFLEEWVHVSPQPTGVQVTDLADLRITTAPGTPIIFSPGVTGSIPEPSTWFIMLIGVGGLGAATRSRRSLQRPRRPFPIA
jgi:PEP-CTERM motif